MAFFEPLRNEPPLIFSEHKKKGIRINSNVVYIVIELCFLPCLQQIFSGFTVTKSGEMDLCKKKSDVHTAKQGSL